MVTSAGVVRDGVQRNVEVACPADPADPAGAADPGEEQPLGRLLSSGRRWCRATDDSSASDQTRTGARGGAPLGGGGRRT